MLTSIAESESRREGYMGTPLFRRIGSVAALAVTPFVFTRGRACRCPDKAARIRSAAIYPV
jgi:hypothetical protein